MQAYGGIATSLRGKQGVLVVMKDINDKSLTLEIDRSRAKLLNKQLERGKIDGLKSLSVIPQST